MKKSYSSLDLLQEKLSKGKKGVWEYLVGSNRYVTITLPYYSYLRGKIFVEDLRDVFGKEVPWNFDIAYLIYMLYVDFLEQIKRGRIKNEDIALYLIQGKETYLKPKRKESHKRNLTKTHILVFNEEKEHQETEVTEEEKTAYITLRMREKELLRCEVLIHDMEPYLSDYQITVEDVITIIYLDFISSIKNQGNTTKIQKNILAHLHSD